MISLPWQLSQSATCLNKSWWKIAGTNIVHVHQVGSTQSILTSRGKVDLLIPTSGRFSKNITTDHMVKNEDEHLFNITKAPEEQSHLWKTMGPSISVWCGMYPCPQSRVSTSAWFYIQVSIFLDISHTLPLEEYHINFGYIGRRKIGLI